MPPVLPNACTYTVHRRVGAFATLRPEWNGLLERSAFAAIFPSWEWQSA